MSGCGVLEVGKGEITRAFEIVCEAFIPRASEEGIVPSVYCVPTVCLSAPSMDSTMCLLVQLLVS